LDSQTVTIAADSTTPTIFQVVIHNTLPFPITLIDATQQPVLDANRFSIRSATDYTGTPAAIAAGDSLLVSFIVAKGSTTPVNANSELKFVFKETTPLDKIIRLVR